MLATTISTMSGELKIQFEHSYEWTFHGYAMNVSLCAHCGAKRTQEVIYTLAPSEISWEVSSFSITYFYISLRHWIPFSPIIQFVQMFGAQTDTHTQCLPFFVYSSYSFHFISLCWYCWWYFLALYVCYFCQSKQQQQKKRIKEKPFRSIEFVYNNLSQHPSSVLLIHFICVLLIARYSSLCNSTKVKRYLYFLYTCRIHSMVIFWLQKGSYHGIIHTHISINIEVFDRKYNKRKQTRISICMRLFGKFSLSFITVWTNDFPYGTKYCFVYGLCVLRNISLDPSYSL